MFHLKKDECLVFGSISALIVFSLTVSIIRLCLPRPFTSYAVRSGQFSSTFQFI